jgi:cellulose synthase/poly-beta-1,6-N-acetylglucosamine synthase-like glycosyltransferase
MMLHVLFILAGILILLLTLPLLLELAILTPAALLFALQNKVLGRKSCEAKSTPQKSPALIVLVPAHNEAKLIARTVQSLQAAETNAATSVRICVIAHNCSDGTAPNATTAGAVVLELNDPALGGKGNALLYGFTKLAPRKETAEETVFVIIDSDTVVASDLLFDIQQAIAFGAEAVQCRYEAIRYNEAGKRKASLAALAFRAFNVVRARGRAQLGLSCGIFGNGFALRADLLTRIPYNAHSVVEDLEYHIALVRSGVRVKYLDYARLQGEITGTRSQKTRWDGGRARMVQQWLPSLGADVLRGRLRMIGPALYICSLPLAQGVLLLLIALLLPLGWLRITAVAGLVVVMLHVVTAILAGDHPADDFKLLLRLPGYFVAKIAALPATLRMTRSSAAWVRTSRDNEGKSPNVKK